MYETKTYTKFYSSYIILEIFKLLKMCAALQIRIGDNLLHLACAISKLLVGQP